MLCIGTGLSPNDRRCVIDNFMSFSRNGFPIAFHHHLLQECREQSKILIIWNNCMRMHIITNHIQSIDKSQNDRDIILNFFTCHMHVHFMGTGEELFKMLITNADCNGKSNGRPHGISSTDPIPKTENTIRWNSKCTRLFYIRRNCTCM